MRLTGVVREAEIFVAVLGASSLTYAEATWTQALPDWIGAHVRMFRFWGAGSSSAGARQSQERRAQGHPSTTPRSIAATAPWRHITASAFCQHGRITPRTRQRWRSALRIAQYYILGRLRNLTFFSLAECNAAIRRDPGAAERSADAPPRAQPAPTVRDDRAAGDAAAAPDRLRVRRMARSPGSASTITSRSPGSSIPSRTRLIREQVETRLTERTVEVFHRGQLGCRAAAALRRPATRHRA